MQTITIKLDSLVSNFTLNLKDGEYIIESNAEYTLNITRDIQNVMLSKPLVEPIKEEKSTVLKDNEYTTLPTTSLIVEISKLDKYLAKHKLLDRTPILFIEHENGIYKVHRLQARDFSTISHLNITHFQVEVLRDHRDLHIIPQPIDYTPSHLLSKGKRLLIYSNYSPEMFKLGTQAIAKHYKANKDIIHELGWAAEYPTDYRPKIDPPRRVKTSPLLKDPIDTFSAYAAPFIYYLKDHDVLVYKNLEHEDFSIYDIAVELKEEEKLKALNLLLPIVPKEIEASKIKSNLTTIPNSPLAYTSIEASGLLIDKESVTLFVEEVNGVYNIYRNLYKNKTIYRNLNIVAVQLDVIDIVNGEHRLYCACTLDRKFRAAFKSMCGSKYTKSIDDYQITYTDEAYVDKFTVYKNDGTLEATYSYASLPPFFDEGYMILPEHDFIY